jgi:hypothetical protein|tara:strand:- start:399 stop:677 length:279 start_codon:yes stop_codon:yes gene_type:complete
MDFLQDIEDYNSAMDNAYDFVTKRVTLDDIFEQAEESGELTSFMLPFDPIESDGRDEATLDLLIEHFTETEEYEKCQELLNIKNRFLKTQQD